MVRSKMRHWATLGLVALSFVCLLASVASAHISPMKDATLRCLVTHDDGRFFERNIGMLLVQNNKGKGKLSRKGNSQVREWDQMTPEEKGRYQKRYQELKKMSPKERKRYEKWHQQWQQLSPQERQKIRNKLKRSEELSPQEIDNIRRRFKN